MNKKKIELQVLNISNSQAQAGAYALVLGEVGGKRQLPIIIGATEAQAMVIEMKGIVPPRPLTHNLFASVLEVLGVKLMRILIYKVDNGVFYSYLYMKAEETILRIDARTSDAVALALRMNAPIFVYEEILETECLKTGESTTDPMGGSEPDKDELLQEDTIGILKTALQKAIEEEDYERAAQIRDQINQLKTICNMHVFYTPDIQTHAELPEEEAAHAVRVLRLQAGDEVMLTDGKGCFYRAEISTATNKRCLVNILETLPQAPLWKGHLHIAMAPTKNMDRTEWFAEKATEIGFDELTFLNCRFSERKVIKTERISKILVSAIKQSLKARLPQLNEMTDFNKFITQPFPGQKFIAHCYEGEKQLLKDIVHPGEDALVLIGPEGDFSEEEVRKATENGFIPISLGKSRLRTETAALVACHILNLQNQ